MVTRVLNTLKVKCINWIGGCNVIEEYRNIANHEKNCEFSSSANIKYGNLSKEIDKNEFQYDEGVKKFEVDVKDLPDNDEYELKVY